MFILKIVLSLHSKTKNMKTLFALFAMVIMLTSCGILSKADKQGTCGTYPKPLFKNNYSTNRK